MTIETLPPAVVIRLPLIEKAVPDKEMLPAAVRFWKVEVPAPAVWVIEVAVMFGIVMLFALVNVTTLPGDTRLIPPTTEIEPAEPALKVILPVPPSVLSRAMFAPAAPVFRFDGPMRVTADPNCSTPPAVISPPRETVPTPLCVKLPPKLKTAPEFIVATPLLTRSIGPEPVVVVIGALKVN